MGDTNVADVLTTSDTIKLSNGGRGSGKKDPPREQDYDWGKVLGSGTFGEVKHAIVKKTRKEYAIKIIEKSFLKDQKKNKDIVFNEREILSVLDRHPLVVGLYYTFQNPDSLFFVMDYCPGGELYDLLKKHGTLSLECTKFYAAEMVLALEYIHSKGIIHRDFKPENILLTDKGHIKVIDFGTARKAGKERRSSFEGTPEYMSPEAVSTFDGGSVDWRCDLWSLGVIVYQLITGQLPCRGGTIWETMRKIREKDWVWPVPFPAAALDLCTKLMVPEDERLGAKGYEELKAHPFFAGITWDTLMESTPPPAGPMDPVPVFPAKEAKVVSDSDDEDEDEGEKEPVKGQNGKPKVKNGKAEQNGHENGTDEPAKWEKVLSEGEKIVKMGPVMKKRRMWNVKKRQLILTDAPRLLYVDPLTMKTMGTIPFINLNAIVKSKTQFIVKTQGRDFIFEDKNKGAEEWVKAINSAS